MCFCKKLGCQKRMADRKEEEDCGHEVKGLNGNAAKNVHAVKIETLVTLRSMPVRQSALLIN